MVQRCNSDGTPNTKGQYAKVQIQGSYSRVDGLNQGNIKIESSLRGQNNWKTEFNQSLPSGSNNFSYTRIINNQGQLFNVALSYDIRVTITDKVVDPVRYTEVLPTQNVPFDIGPAGAAVGKMWEPGKGAFQVGGESTFEDVINALAGIKAFGKDVATIEQGTFTPVYKATSGDFSGITYSTRWGRYIRIGSLVFVQFCLTAGEATIGTASGYVIIDGFPFPIVRDTAVPLFTYRWYLDTTGIFFGYTPGNTSYLSLVRYNANGIYLDDQYIPVAEMVGNNRFSHICFGTFVYFCE